MNALIRTAKRRHLKTQFIEARFNARKTWALTNHLMGVKGQQRIDDRFLQSFSCDTEDIVNEFNNYFARFFGEGKDDNVVCTNLQESFIASAFLPSMNEHDLHSLIFRLNSRKSAGVDGIMFDDLRRNFNSVKRVLLVILNGILESGVLPRGIKVAVVRPLRKGGSPSMLTIIAPYRYFRVCPILWTGIFVSLCQPS